MEDNTINHTGSEENVPKVSKSEENGNLDVLGVVADRTSIENNNKSFTSECSDKLNNCVQDSPAHEIHNKKIGIHDSTSEWESACILPSTHKETVCVIPNTHTESACIMPKTHVESACKVLCTHTESACIMSNTHKESACIIPNTHTESACIMSKTHVESVCIMPSTHTESACIMPSTHTESACVMSNTHAESACVMSNTHAESACVMSNIHAESACIMPSTHTESACIMPSTHTESACIMPNTQRKTVERTQVDSNPEIFKDSFQTYVNSEQNQACDNTSKNKCNVRNMKSPSLSIVSTAQNSSQHSGLVIPNKDLSKLFSPSSSLPNLPHTIFPTTNLNTTTWKSRIQINTRNKKVAQATEKEGHNLEKELFSAKLLQGIMNDTEKGREHSKKTCKKHVTFSSSITNETEDSLETNSSKNNEDELFMKNINTSIQNENTADSIMGRFTHGFLSVMEHLHNFAFSKCSSAISEAWEATTIAYKGRNAKYDGPKPRSSLQSHVNRIASKRKFLPSHVDETESEMKIVKRSC